MQHPASDKEHGEAKLAGTGSVFCVHGVSKIYRLGEVEVHALCAFPEIFSLNRVP